MQKRLTSKTVAYAPGGRTRLGEVGIGRRGKVGVGLFDQIVRDVDSHSYEILVGSWLYAAGIG